MTVNGTPLMSKPAPTTEGSEPYLSCQTWKLITATGGAPSWSSASVVSRPIQGFTPKVRKKLPETNCPFRVSTGARDPARHRPRRRALLVVGVRRQPADPGLHAEGPEEIAGNKLPVSRLHRRARS